ncbi:hypothetical protein AB0I81_38975 [Nonomuraea sp. NPDC050404]
MNPVSRVAMLGIATAFLIVASPAAASAQIVADGVPLPPPTGLVDSNIWG